MPTTSTDPHVYTGGAFNQKYLQAFYTPEDVARKVADKACVRDYGVLEPSAGHGALARACKIAGAVRVQCFDLNDEAVRYLKDKGYEAYAKDFLEVNPEAWPKFGRVVMNPPFTRGTDIRHVRHAVKFLRPKGRLVSIMAGNDRTAPFAALVNDLQQRGAKVEIEHLPAGAFKESGTDVRTLILTVQLP